MPSFLQSIGKTTMKSMRREKFSEIVDRLRRKKREMKREMLGERNVQKRNILIGKCILKQEEIRRQILIEKKQKIESVFQKVVKDKSRTLFWKEKRKMMKNSTLEYACTKNENGGEITSLHPNLVSEQGNRSQQNHNKLIFIKDFCSSYICVVTFYAVLN